MAVQASPRRPDLNAASPYALATVSWIVYAVLSLEAPAGTTPKTHYHLPHGALNALRLTILVPLLVFWGVAVYGAHSIKRYASLVAGSREERALKFIAQALFLTLATFIVSAVLGAIMNFYVSSPGYPALVILRDHLVALITLVAFSYFFVGSRALAKTAGLKTFSAPAYWTSGVTILVAIGFAYRILTTHFTSAATVGSSMAYISPVLLLITLILPYFVAWYLGALSVVYIVQYSKKVKGVLYRKALRSLAIGLCLVIAFSALGGALLLVANSVSGLNLGGILLILYVALLLYGAGYLFVASGAKKLTKLETAGN